MKLEQNQNKSVEGPLLECHGLSPRSGWRHNGIVDLQLKASLSMIPHATVNYGVSLTTWSNNAAGSRMYVPVLFAFFEPVEVA